MEMTQPQGHSTSGSHERYKSKHRLKWEADFDPIKKMGEWIVQTGISSQEDIDLIMSEAKKTVRLQKAEAWNAYINPIKQEQQQVLSLMRKISDDSPNKVSIEKLINDLSGYNEPSRKDVFYSARKCLRLARNDQSSIKSNLSAWVKKEKEINANRYSSHLYSASELASLKIEEVLPVYNDDAKDVDGRIIIRDNFDVYLKISLKH